MTTRTKPRRRWFQFSLRTLMVLVAVVAVWLALTVNAARKQREAVAAIEAWGVMFTTSMNNSGGL